jgi:hypothetical protein
MAPAFARFSNPANGWDTHSSPCKTKRNLPHEEFKRQQAFYKEHADSISQAKLFGKHWHFREKHLVLVVDGMVVGRV